MTAGVVVLLILLLGVALAACGVGYKLGESKGFGEGLTRFKRQRDREVETLKRTHVEELNVVAAEWKRKLDEEKAKEQARQAEAKEQARQAEAEEAKRRSPWARDIPKSRVFEVASVPYGTVTLHAELRLDERELLSETKTNLLHRLSDELLKDAVQYIEIERYDEPLMWGSTFRATLRVLRRQG